MATDPYEKPSPKNQTPSVKELPDTMKVTHRFQVSKVTLGLGGWGEKALSISLLIACRKFWQIAVSWSQE